MNEDFLYHKLHEREAQHSLRQLKLPVPGMIDLCSNDYLGIARHRLLKSSAPGRDINAGSTGSRLLTGNYSLIEETERSIAIFHQAASALIFNSGYEANIGLLSAVARRGDTVLYDQFSHASIRDGIRLSFAESFSFQHNDMADLDNKLQRTRGTVFVVTESVFSMDGDICPLTPLILLCEKYKAHLIIDEAHATGVIGEHGEGLVQLLGAQEKIFARVHTFGKACGSHGAVVLGSELLRNYLINFARSFIYSTALPEKTVADISASYTLFPRMREERKKLGELITRFQAFVSRFERIKSSTPIQGVIIPGNERIRQVAGHLQSQNLDVRPILYPTVPQGRERLRVVLHTFNTPQELDLLHNSLENSL